jgi:hypothetical protein
VSKTESFYEVKGFLRRGTHSILHGILTRIPESIQEEEHMRYKYCRLLVLIQINKALIDRQDPPLAIDLFIKDLLWVFLELDLDNDPNPLLVPGPRSGTAWYGDAEEPAKLSGRPS